MTLQDRATMATNVRIERKLFRAALVRRALADGHNLKRAAHIVGVPYRTASRYTQDMR